MSVSSQEMSLVHKRKRCACTKSDSWRCAKERNIQQIACNCPCHSTARGSNDIPEGSNAFGLFSTSVQTELAPEQTTDSSSDSSTDCSDD